MRKMISTVILLFLMNCQMRAQSLDAGVFLGMSNYQGDLQSTHYVSTENKIAFGAFAKYRFLEFLAVRASFYKGQISGSDAKAGENNGRRGRNLSFRSKIHEYSLQAEFNPMPFLVDEPKLVSPYIFTGIALFQFSPETYYDETWTALQPLGTEGQNLDNSNVDPYKLTQFSIPMGFGLEIRVSDYSSIGIEAGIRKTFTDYLDDVSGLYPDIDQLAETNPTAAGASYRVPEYTGQNDFENPVGMQRGNPDRKDLYLFTGMTFSFNISEIISLGNGPGNYSAF